MTSFYCQHCDKSINRIFKRKHNKSKTHLYMYHNIVINKYNIGDVFSSDFESIIQDYIRNFDKKFYSFMILLNCVLNGSNLNISVDNINRFIFLYKFKDIGSVFYEYNQSKKVWDYVFRFAKTKDINLIPSSIINDVSIIIYSKYNTMTPRYRLIQNRSVLESKLLKNICNLPLNDKLNKYKFLSLKYELFQTNLIN